MTNESSTPPLVAIGAAEGGLAALTGFFQALPDCAAMAYVVALRDDTPDPAAALAGRVDLPVRTLAGHEALSPGRIYLLPPGRRLRLDPAGLAAGPPDGGQHPVNALFTSLAHYPGETVAMVLSGKGSDGALGLRAVVENGGLVLVQDLREAGHDAMPRAAADTGLAQAVLPVRALARQLAHWRDTRALDPARWDEAETAVLHRILARLGQHTGRDFGHYRRESVVRRLARRLRLHRLERLDDYLELVQREPAELTRLCQELLIPVSGFFRDPPAWEALRTQVLGPLLERHPPEQRLRFWVAGCATGEEAYGLAMLVEEEAARRQRWVDFQVFATDIHERALASARAGRYSTGIEDCLDPARLERFFQREGDHYRVLPEIRQRVTFAVHDLLRDPPYSHLHLATCRNLLLYLDETAHARALQALHHGLHPDGHLLLGNADPPPGAGFEVVDDVQRLFRATGAARPVFPSVDPVPVTLALPRRPDSPARQHRQVLEQLAPPSVLVDAEYRILHLSEGAGRYLRLSGGAPSHRLTELILPPLAGALRAALGQVFHHGTPWLGEPVALTLDGETRRVMLQASSHPGDGDARALLLFLEGQPAPPAPTRHDDPRGGELQARLAHSDQAQRATADELRRTEEQLRSLNEEYRTVVEELDANQEELHTVNEELRMSNLRLKEQLDAAARDRDHLGNLINATETGILFLDRQLRIQWFSPPTQRLFALRPVDRDRPLGDLAHRFVAAGDLGAEAAAVLNDLATREQELRDLDDHWWLLRLRPYRTAEQHIDGVVMSFVDITAHKQAELAWRHSEVLGQELAVVNRLHRMAMAMVTAASVDDALAETLNAALALLHTKAGCVQVLEDDELRPVQCRGVSAAVFADGPLRTLAGEALARREPIVIEDLDQNGEPQHRQLGDLTGCRGIQILPLLGRHGSCHGVLSLCFQGPRPPRREDRQLLDLLARQASDVIERLRTEASLHEAARHKDAFLGLLGHELRNPLAALMNGLHLLEALELPDPTAGRTVAMLVRQGRHMARLVDDLLDITRIDQGKIELSRQTVVLNACMAEVVATLRPQLEAGELELDLQLPEPSLQLDADPDRLAQVLGNLLGNAIKFTPAGGRITLTAGAADGQAWLRIRDTGVGIEHAQLEGIFGAFSQIEGEHQRRGLGLGLALVRSLVNLHGGEVHAHSEGPGRGSEFRLRWPLATTAQAVAPAPATKPAGRGRRLLVVDDNRDTADAFAILLRTLGHTVAVAYSGEAALASVGECRPEMVFLDLGMPGMNGVELAERLHERLGEDCPALVAVTGHGQPMDREHTRQAGFSHHLLKPAPIDEVRALLGGIEA